MANKQASLLKMRANYGIIIEQAGAVYAKKSPRETVVFVAPNGFQMPILHLSFFLPPIACNIYHNED